MPEVIVIGGGLAGCWAATTAARLGADVTVVRRAPGATAVSSGAVDFVPPDDSENAELWLASLPRHRPEHPFAAGGVVAGASELRAEAEGLARELGAAGLPMRVSWEAPMLLADVHGRVRRTVMAQESVAAGDLRRCAGTTVVVATVAGLLHPDPVFVATALRQQPPPGTPGDAQPLTLPPPPALSRGLPGGLDPATVARALERPGAAEALGRSLADAAGRLESSPGLALLAPVMGLDEAEAVRERLSAAAGIAVAELLSPPPSAPGWRLQAACERMAAGAGATLVSGQVEEVELDRGRALAVRLTGGARLECRALVLATGKYLGGGLSLDRLPRERLLDLPVFAGGAPTAGLQPADLVARSRFREQPFLTAGLRTDGRGRPVDGFGRVVVANLAACGAICAGVDATLDGGGLGAAAWTAARAARTAVEEAGSVPAARVR
ncbi:MAG: FAD-dependent oxidoreductase [Chloroflexi bacterium]|nr:MAG: FAD-dependent oxidoreductase [Chloroflexota bacterium]